MTTINNRGLKGNPTLPYADFRSFAGEDAEVDLTFLDYTGQAVTPYSAIYQLDDLSNAINMVPQTNLAANGSFTTSKFTLTLPASVMQMSKQFQGSQTCQLNLSFSYKNAAGFRGVVQGQFVIELVAIQTPSGVVLTPTPAP